MKRGTLRRDFRKAAAWRQRSPWSRKGGNRTAKNVRQALKRTAMRQVSPKQAKRNRQRTKLLAQIVQGRPCAAKWDEGCTGIAEHGHEPLTRARGGSELDADNVIPVCAYCHDKIHGNPTMATRRGLLISGYSSKE